MGLLQWKASYSLGVSSVDHEHRRMIHAINDIHASLAGDAEPASIEAALGEIHAAIAAHFALEEKLMRASAYSQYHEHKQDHEALLDQLRDMMDEYASDPVKGEAVLRQSLSDWFENHFSTFDARVHGLVV